MSAPKFKDIVKSVAGASHCYCWICPKDCCEGGYITYTGGTELVECVVRWAVARPVAGLEGAPCNFSWTNMCMHASNRVFSG